MARIRRRDFIKAMTAISATCAMRGKSASAASRNPNIVLVLADDLGWGDLGCYNPHSDIPTPNADRLAREGMRWTDMHSADAVCTPSRYSILTGRYCWRTTLKRGVTEGYSPALIDPERMTIASMLKQQGYATFGTGKWHLGLGSDARTDFTKPIHPGPIDLGFDYFFGIPASLDMPPYLYFENDHVIEDATADTPGSKDRGAFWRAGAIAPHFDLSRVLPTCTAKAVQIIEDRAKTPDQPFFLYFAMPSPHTPWLPLPEFKGKSRAGDYGDYVAECDAMLGRVLDAIEKCGFSQDTIFLFASDNGADWRLDDMARYEHRANADWRGQKADIWEGGHRIPFIARWPGHIRTDSTTDDLGCLVDLMATAAAVTSAHLPQRAAEDSFNQLPVLLGHRRSPVRDSLVDHSWDGMFCIQEGDWKLELGLGSGGWNSQPEHVDPVPGGPKGQLYNMAVDPYERNNVYQENPQIVTRLTVILERIQQQGFSRPME
jgi:arylsulfatase A